jgi:hypothetical protein
LRAILASIFSRNVFRRRMIRTLFSIMQKPDTNVCKNPTYCKPKEWL